MWMSWFLSLVFRLGFSRYGQEQNLVHQGRWPFATMGTSLDADSKHPLEVLPS